MKKGPLFQVFVTVENGEIPIGPAVANPQILDGMVSAINIAVASGKEKTWRDARIAQVEHVESE